MITLENLSKSYGPTRILSGVTETIAAGEFVVLLGMNGSGKSTLFRCILGLTTYEGGVAVDGESPLQKGKSVRSKIGYMPQQCGLHLDLTVEETLLLYAMVRNTSPDVAFGLLDRMNLGAVRQRRVGELSGGMRQRLAFVVASFAGPKVLILDEPIANLDRESQGLILSHLIELHEQKTTVLLSTHLQHDLLRLADRMVLMSDGKLWDPSAFEDLHTVVDTEAVFTRRP
jgi:ABC-type multidrug transport system ATPase subunit